MIYWRFFSTNSLYESSDFSKADFAHRLASSWLPMIGKNVFLNYFSNKFNICTPRASSLMCDTKNLSEDMDMRGRAIGHRWKNVRACIVRATWCLSATVWHSSHWLLAGLVRLSIGWNKFTAGGKGATGRRPRDIENRLEQAWRPFKGEPCLIMLYLTL